MIIDFEYEVGDTAVVIHNDSYHAFPVGTFVVINNALGAEYPNVPCEKLNDKSWFQYVPRADLQPTFETIVKHAKKQGESNSCTVSFNQKGDVTIRYNSGGVVVYTPEDLNAQIVAKCLIKSL